MTHFVPPPVVGILLLACSSPAWASQSPPDTTKYQAVNDSFALILAEYLDPRLASARDSGPSLYMVATRRRAFSCLLPLGMSLNSRGSHIDLYLAGVPRGPQLCPSAIGPARGTVRLPAKVGAYDIVIRRPDGLEDTYTLLVTDTLTEVTTLASRYNAHAGETLASAPQHPQHDLHPALERGGSGLVSILGLHDLCCMAARLVGHAAVSVRGRSRHTISGRAPSTVGRRPILRVHSGGRLPSRLRAASTIQSPLHGHQSAQRLCTIDQLAWR